MADEKDGLTILGLHVENVRAVKVISIYPPAIGLVKIKGANAAGKSSTLDAIQCALGGKAVQPEEPIRKGESTALVVADLGKYTVKRSWSPKGTYLTVEAKQDGTHLKVAKPQEFLDTIVGSGIGFDPLEFTRKKPAAQVEQLLAIANLPEDPRALDQQRKVLYDQRTDANRQAKQAEGALVNFAALPADTPDEEISSASLLQDFKEQQRILTENQQKRQSFAAATDKVTRIASDVERLKSALVEAEAELAEAKMYQVEAQEACTNLIDPDLRSIQIKMQETDAVNANVRKKRERKTVAATLKGHTDRAAELTEQIAALDKKKTALLTQSALPLPDLGIGEMNGGYGITYRGIPLEQCSSSEKLRISMALAMALAPKVRVILVREGSLLDPDSQNVLEDYAREHGIQIWFEEVGTEAEDGAFIIEDGEVKETPTPH